MTRSIAFLAGAALAAAAAGLAGAASAPRAGAPDEHAGRYAIATLAGAGGGAFVTDTATGDTAFCTPRVCRKLAMRAAAAPAARPAPAAPRTGDVDAILRAAPPDFAPPPPDAPPAGAVDPALRNF